MTCDLQWYDNYCIDLYVFAFICKYVVAFMFLQIVCRTWIGPPLVPAFLAKCFRMLVITPPTIVHINIKCHNSVSTFESKVTKSLSCDRTLYKHACTLDSICSRTRIEVAFKNAIYLFRKKGNLNKKYTVNQFIFNAF